MKILILTYYYPPSGGSGVQRWLYFSKYLSDFGIEPYVITVNPDKASYKFIDEELLQKVNDVKVFRTDTKEILSVYTAIKRGEKRKNIPQGFSGESDPNLFQKVSRFFRGNFFLPDARRGWNKYAFKKAVELITKEKIGVVITSGPPHSTHLTGLRLKKKFGVKWIADFRDPWTEVYYNRMLYRTSLASKIDYGMEKKVLENADRVLTIGPGMQKLLQKKLNKEQKEKVIYIYNGYDGKAFESISKTPSGRFSIVHSGILSDNQPIDAFLEGLKKFISQNPDAKEHVQLVFVGNVSPAILGKAESALGKDNLILTGYLSQSEALQKIMNAELLLNSFAISDESALLVSGKLMDYIATGNPIIGLGHPEGDAAELLKNYQDARIFDRSDVEGIQLFIERIYLQWQKGGRKFNRESYSQFSRERTTEELAEVIRNL